MGWALYCSFALTTAVFVHLRTIRVDEPVPVAAEGEPTSRIDIRGTIESIRAVPGLMMPAVRVRQHGVHRRRAHRRQGGALLGKASRSYGNLALA